MPDTAQPPLPTDNEPILVEPTIIEPVAPPHKPELRTVFLGGLVVLALLAGCYAAAEIILPMVLAFVLNAVFQPLQRLLLRLHLPRPAAAIAIVLSLVTVFAIVGFLLSVPLSDRIAQLPETLPKIQERLHFLKAPVNSLQNALKHIEDLGTGPNQPTIAVRKVPLAQRILGNVQLVAAGAFTTLLILFFLLIAGEQFKRRLVEILPEFSQKRQVVEISDAIEHDISIYLATVTMMNAAVGVATAIVAWLTGLGAPLLWGTIAFLLNYVPILGPTAGVILFLIAGLVTIEPLWAAFMPAMLYLLIHVAEGETITPMLLAARFTVNPVLVTLGVIFWYWMWGVVGAILSTPMLAIVKIVCDRIETLKPVGHFIGGEPIVFGGNGKAAS